MRKEAMKDDGSIVTSFNWNEDVAALACDRPAETPILPKV